MNVVTWIHNDKTLFFSWPDGDCSEVLRGLSPSSPKEEVRAACSSKSYLLSKDFKLIEDRRSHDLNFYEHGFFPRNEKLIKEYLKEKNLL